MINLRKLVFITAFITLVVFPASALAEPVTVNWWFAHGGRLGEKVQEIVGNFNSMQSKYKVVATYKGNYTDTMNAGIAAFRSKNPPHILQVFEVGTASMMGAKGAIQPVYQIMAKSGQPWTSDAYLSTVTGYYTTADGKMLSMPFNSSTPVLYYNVEAFQKAGLDPDKPPKTWTEVADYARKLVKAGYPAGFSTAWPDFQRPGYHGFMSKTSAPGTTCPSGPSPTGLRGWIPSSYLTARCM
jgi:sn-glycerol 3-phosphate transport system substrate-binding protein